MLGGRETEKGPGCSTVIVLANFDANLKNLQLLHVVCWELQCKEICHMQLHQFCKSTITNPWEPDSHAYECNAISLPVTTEARLTKHPDAELFMPVMRFEHLTFHLFSRAEREEFLHKYFLPKLAVCFGRVAFQRNYSKRCSVCSNKTHNFVVILLPTVLSPAHHVWHTWNEYSHSCFPHS